MVKMNVFVRNYPLFSPDRLFFGQLTLWEYVPFFPRKYRR